MYSELSQTSKMELIAEIVDISKVLGITQKLHLWFSWCSCDNCNNKVKLIDALFAFSENHIYQFPKFEENIVPCCSFTKNVDHKEFNVTKIQLTHFKPVLTFFFKLSRSCCRVSESMKVKAKVWVHFTKIWMKTSKWTDDNRKYYTCIGISLIISIWWY